MTAGDHLGHYVRLHLTGSASGIALFGRGSSLQDTAARPVIGQIRAELIEERRQLLTMAEAMGIRPAPLTALVATVGERASRLKPNGNPFQRTALSDLIDLETMRLAVSGKLAGWQALLSVVDQHDGLDRVELEALEAQACRQRDQIAELHRDAAARALQH